MQRIKVINLHQKKFRKRFEAQKKDPNFLDWKLKRYNHQGGLCFYCHQHIELKGSHIDHLVPLWRGGTNERANLVISCPTCNMAKSTKIKSTQENLALRQKLNVQVKNDLKHIQDEQDEINDMLRSF